MILTNINKLIQESIAHNISNFFPNGGIKLNQVTDAITHGAKREAGQAALAAIQTTKRVADGAAKATTHQDTDVVKKANFLHRHAGKIAVGSGVGATGIVGVNTAINNSNNTLNNAPNVKRTLNTKYDTATSKPKAEVSVKATQSVAPSEAPAAKLYSHTPWKTDHSGHVAGTKLSPEQYNQYLSKKFGVDIANQKIANASGPGWSGKL